MVYKDEGVLLLVSFILPKLLSSKIKVILLPKFCFGERLGLEYPGTLSYYHCLIACIYIKICDRSAQCYSAKDAMAAVKLHANVKPPPSLLYNRENDVNPTQSKHKLRVMVYYTCHLP